jgi:hypothetical protein
MPYETRLWFRSFAILSIRFLGNLFYQIIQKVCSKRVLGNIEEEDSDWNSRNANEFQVRLLDSHSPLSISDRLLGQSRVLLDRGVDVTLWRMSPFTSS